MKSKFFWGQKDEQRMEKKMPGRHSQKRTRMLMSPRGLANSLKLARKTWKKHKNLDDSDRKERFRPGCGAPAAFPDDPIAQTVVDILQRRFDPLPNPYDDVAVPHDKTHPFLVSYLRNLLALAVDFCVINHSLEVNCKVDYMTSAKREPSNISNYNFPTNSDLSLNSLLQLRYFDCNTINMFLQILPIFPPSS